MKLIITDCLVIGAIIMIVSALAMTNYMVQKMTTMEEFALTVKQAAELFEAAPLTKIALQFKQFGFIFSMIFVPAFIGGSYYALRRKWAHDLEKYKFALDSFAMTLFLVGVTNVINDFSILLGSIR